MIRICLVDDDDDNVSKIGNYLENFKTVCGKTFSLKRFHNAYDTMLYFKPIYDLIFLRVKGGGITGGIEAAKAIRKYDAVVSIVFIADKGDLAVEGYDVGAAGYLLKPVSFGAFQQTMLRIVDILEQCDEKYLLLHRENGLVKLPVRTVKYIESKEHLITVHSEKGQFSLFSSLKEMQKNLTNGAFAKCNSCYLVNFKYVEEIKENTVILTGGIHLKISKNKKKNFIEMLKHYVGNVV